MSVTLILSDDELSCITVALIDGAIKAQAREHWASAARNWNLARRMCSAVPDKITRIETAENCRIRALECIDILNRRVSIATYRAERGMPPLKGI